MAETPTKNVTFVTVIKARDVYHNETFDNEDVTCEADLCDDLGDDQQEERVEADAEGSACVSVDVSVTEGELQPPKIDECDKAKNETFHNETFFHLLPALISHQRTPIDGRFEGCRRTLRAHKLQPIAQLDTLPPHYILLILHRIYIYI